CFTWRASCQQKWDYLAFSIDGEEIARISGSFGPETRTFAVPAGEHTLAWTYVKDEAYGVYDDKGYLDEVHVVSVSPDANNLDSLLDAEAAGLNFENDAAEPWTNNGSGAAVSGNAGKSASESAITLRKALAAGETLRFNWGVSSEKDHDFLVFEVNGEEYASISGEVDPGTAGFYTAQEDGEYVFRWVYRKDTLNNFGSDRGFLSGVAVGGYVAMTGVMIVKNTTIATGKSLKLAVAARPTNATNKAVSWESDNETVAVVSEDGTVTGISAGTANITVTTEEGGFTSVCALTVTPFAADIEYYVNAATGKDTNKGNTASAALRTLKAAYQLIYKNVPPGGTVKLYVSGKAAASEELRVFDKEVNIVALGEGAEITRASGYKGVLIRVSGGGILRLGDTAASGTLLTVGNSSAAAPAVLVDGGTCYLDKASITGNSSTVSGAGVYVKKGAFVMSGGTIASNATSRFGGGIYAEEGEVTLLGGSVSGNTAGIYGGGAYIATGVEHELSEEMITGNTAGKGFDDICYGEPPAAPEIVGVEDGAEYSLDDYPEGVSVAWSGDAATATLNGEPYEEGSKITEPGDYVLTVTDGFSVVTVS
ncbi:MAG: Ig-like domain-containing protein, partial [Clostridia bacterium]|nr:Ig-like domain-containing protein [Clostridia bacterium]